MDKSLKPRRAASKECIAERPKGVKSKGFAIARPKEAQGKEYIVTRSGMVIIPSPAKSPNTTVNSWSKAFKK